MLFFLLIAASFVHILARTDSEYADYPNLPMNNDVDMRYFLDEIRPGIYIIQDLLQGEINTKVSPEDLTYHFYSRENPIGTPIKSSSIDQLKKTRFARNRDTVFIIHGFEANHECPASNEIKDVIIKRTSVNAFIVDWSPIAQRNYSSAAMSVAPTGNLIGDFVNSLVRRYRISVSRVVLIGLSLGAHIAGNAGAALNGEVDHIVGLDPAGPLFYEWNAESRLNPSHAKFVHVIHTNALRFGYYFPCGHSDFYPNGGGAQPGCGWFYHWACSHQRSYDYYIESIESNQNQFVARKCSYYLAYKLGLCSRNPTSVLGGYPVDKRANGTYYLDTNSDWPFAMGLRKNRREQKSTTAKL